MKQYKVDQSAANQRVDRYIGKLLPKAKKGEIQRWIRTKKIKRNAKRTHANERVLLDDSIQVYLPDAVIESYIATPRRFNSDQTGIHIVYEDDQILIVHKPSGLLTHPDQNEYKKTLATRVQGYLQPFITATFRPSSVNRLDKNTSGLVLFCKTYQALKDYNQMMRERKIKKLYHAIVEGVVDKEYTIEGYLVKDEAQNKVRLYQREVAGSKAVCTIVKPIAIKAGFTKVLVDLKTGRSHQIRASLAHIGYPIVGDRKYGGHQHLHVTTQLLHAYQLEIADKVFSYQSEIMQIFWENLGG